MKISRLADELFSYICNPKNSCFGVEEIQQIIKKHQMNNDPHVKLSDRAIALRAKLGLPKRDTIDTIGISVDEAKAITRMFRLVVGQNTETAGIETIKVRSEDLKALERAAKRLSRKLTQ
jgi:hypothetical protein